MRIRRAAILTILLVAEAICQSSEPQVSAPPSSSAITADNLMQTVRFLASPERAGRLPGQAGYQQAAAFMQKEFQGIGLKPLGDSLFYQFFDLEYNEIHAPLRLTLRQADGTERVFRPGSAYVCRGFTGSGKVAGQVVFCGYGLTQAPYDDYDGMNVQGKVVMVIKASPSWTINGSPWQNTSIRQKAAVAAAHGARAVLFLPHPSDLNAREPIISVMHGEGKQLTDLPQLALGSGATEELLRSSGSSLRGLVTVIDSLKSPHSFALQSEAEIEVHAAYTPARRTMNVVGMLEGSDPARKGEYVVVGAHLDHVGSQAGTIIAPGANDNASGSAAVLEMARTFVRNGLRPQRSILFVLFAGEEQGLLGSTYFVNHSPVRTDSICAMLNLDCIGVGDSIQVGNGMSAPHLWSLIHALDSSSSHLMITPTWSGGGADGAPFHQKGIPVAYFVTKNSYAHLHSIYDTPDTFNERLYEAITRLAYRAAEAVANGRYAREEAGK